MARRILPADSALMPSAQAPLQSPRQSAQQSTRQSPRNLPVQPLPAASTSVRTEFHGGRGGLLPGLDERWNQALALAPGEVLFDWEDRSALMSEIAFVNQAREKLDEAVLKIAPAMLRIVLTVKAHVPAPKAQRAFLAEHMEWDLRRISELCIVADSYGLLEPGQRREGQGEIERYGWSNALKLAYVRDPAERADLWERARRGKPKASYRAILEEIKRFRERKMIGPPPPQEDLGQRLLATKTEFAALESLGPNLTAPEEYQEALRHVSKAQQELSRLKRTLKERLEAAETEALAVNV